MTSENDNDTICAIATPPGTGGIAILRLSGPHAKEIVASICAVSGIEPNTLRHAYFREGDELLDEGVVSYFRAPRSYTGEDVIEISCHGGWHASETIQQALLRHGARLANPGEFTLRAFLNGKMDLAQAEAVAGLVAAHTKSAGKAALRQLEGGLSNKIKQMRAKILDMMALIEVELDFSDEDIQFATREERTRTIGELIENCERLSESYRQGRLLREGIRVAIVGPPNSGKSTLFNSLVEEERAIVSPHPGTTRDVIEARLDMGGFEVILLDTAGVHDSGEEIEKAGISKALREIQRADVLFLVIDINEHEKIDKGILSEIKERPVVVVWNKVDLFPTDKLVSGSAASSQHRIECRVSALHHQGLDELKQAMKELVFASETDTREIQVTEARHKQEIDEASESLRRALNGLDDATLCAADLRDAADALGRITGETIGEEILDRIFSKFCIGK
ncbi:tRNA uridine-5-carboxymethylaminomethyl(34) synthesis GTPase MnmE [bacterium]|nr:tRNA uridine-5-carboxymethylaminomethyl(34) synthesis GTPase MnmE [bacterium]